MTPFTVSLLDELGSDCCALISMSKSEITYQVPRLNLEEVPDYPRAMLPRLLWLSWFVLHGRPRRTLALSGSRS